MTGLEHREEECRSAALRIGEHLAAVLTRNELPPTATLGDGAIGTAVFLHHVGGPEHRFQHLVDQLVRKVIRDLKAITMPPSLYSGYVGVAWGLNHLAIHGAEVADVVLDSIDDAVIRVVEARNENLSFDLINGLVGLGVYAMARDNADMLAQIVRELGRRGERSSSTVTWRTWPRQTYSTKLRGRFPDGWYDLGIAHGIPGVVCFLAEAAKRGVASAPEYVDGGVAWLRNIGVREADELSFGSLISPDYREYDYPARSAWCYGDPGAGMALVVAADALGRADLLKEGLGLLERAMDRSPNEARVVDPGICHGAAGLALIYSRFASQSNELRKAAKGWVDMTLEAISSDGRVRARRRDGAALRGLLEGASGVGMALLDAAGSDVAGWTSPFLIPETFI